MSSKTVALAILLACVACSPQPANSSPRPTPSPRVAVTRARQLPTPKTDLATTPTAPTTPPPTAPAPNPEPVEGPGPELPTGFVAIPHPLDGNDDHAVCGGLTVTNVLDRKALGQQGLYEPFVRVTDTNGTKIYEAHGRRYTIDTTSVTMALVADFCGDLDGDGVMDLVLTERTMGAHCCYTHYAVSMTRPAKRLLMWEKGDAGTGIWPVKAKPGSSWQLMSTVVVWPPFDAEAGEPSLSYATAPLLPIIFTLESGTYRARTFRFSDFLRKHRAEARQRCKSNPDCEISEIIEWGYALIIGDWPSVRPTIDTEPYILQALDRRAAATTKQLRRELGF